MTAEAVQTEQKCPVCGRKLQVVLEGDAASLACPACGEVHTPPAPPTFAEGHIDRFLSRRVCSRCYGDLVKAPAPGRLWSASCPTCGPAWAFTTVSRRYAIQLGQRALGDYYEVKANLPDLFPADKTRTPEDILKELGF